MFFSLVNCLPQPAQSLGAVYFQTNNPQGNMIVVSSIQQDGSLAFSKMVPTNGKGGLSIDAATGSPVGADPLFTQDSVITGDGFLFTVNAGSNCVSMFKINPRDPTDIRLIANPSTQGEFPVSLAYSSRLRMLCALNGGQKNGVHCFQVSENGLQSIPGSTRPLPFQQTTPPKGPLGTASDILFSENSDQLLVSVKGNPPANFTGFVASFPIQQRTLAQQPIINVPSGSVAPFSMSLVPSVKDRVLFTDAGVGFGLGQLNRDGKITASQTIPVQGQGAICWSDFSQKTGSVYMVDIKTSLVTEVDKDGQLIKQHPLSGNTIDMRIASLDQDFLYVNTPGDQSVKVLRLDARGQTTLVQSLQFDLKGALSQQGMAVFVPRKSKCQ